MNVVGKVKKIAVGISGGVDSSVAALILRKERYEPVGIFMRNWDLADETGNCNTENEISDAETVCKSIGIKFQVVNFVKEYWNEVFQELINGYQQGLTPNPDILCNKNIKFNYFIKYANNQGCDAIATGHYAKNSFGSRLQYCNKFGANLLQARDERKDQTFFLSQISQDALRKTIFPLGDIKKTQVKKIAVENGLSKIAKKKESMGMCFIGSRKFQSFILDYIKPKDGNFIDINTGKRVGEHMGQHTLTLGQRCLIGGTKEAYYIARKTNTEDILVAMGHKHSILYSQMLITKPSFWINKEPLELAQRKVMKCEFRFQHRNPLVGCTIFKLKSDQLYVKLAQPLRALTPGQFAVFYKGPICLGSARIESCGPSEYSLSL